MSKTQPQENINPLSDEAINDFGHILSVGAAEEGSPGYNSQIEVFRGNKGKARVYQMFAVDEFATNPVAAAAAKEFGLAGDGADKEKWTQLLEHIAGVTAIAAHLAQVIERHGASPIDENAVEAASLFDNLDKQLAVEAGISMLDTAALTHDIEKPAELAAAREMAKGGSAAGMENSRDNPVLREGALWGYLERHGVNEQTIIAAQNTGRSDRYFGELDQYSGDAVKKALYDRESLATLLAADREVVDAMTPDERRMSSIEAKGSVAAVVAIADAMAAQFKFRGMSEASIDETVQYYLGRKKDPESQMFFTEDWPAYYKQVRKYLIGLVPEANQAALKAELDTLTHERIYNETVLPAVLGATTMRRALDKQAKGESNPYDELRLLEQ